jgi:fructoselysine-6-P-deglycase FrlB-like protein
MSGPAGTHEPTGRAAIEAEMSRQSRDAVQSFADAATQAQGIAGSIRRTGRLLMLGMGASHALNRMVEPFFRDLGIDALALPVSEQLDQPLPLAGRTVIVASQSGESAEVVRWLGTARPGAECFGLTLNPRATLAAALPCLIGAGGVETGFAATRSVLVGLALYGRVLAALGVGAAAMVDALRAPVPAETGGAVRALSGVRCIVTSGRRLAGLAEGLALGLTELSRLPAFALEGGQFRHGPMEMLGPEVSAVFFRGADATGDAVRRLAEAVAEAGSPAVVLDASGAVPAAGAETVLLGRHDGLAALAMLIPVSQRLMLDFAATKVAEVGRPLRSTKITRIE